MYLQTNIEIMKSWFLIATEIVITTVAATLVLLPLVTMSKALAADWKPAKPVEFVVMAGKGGAADKAVRYMQGIIAEEKLGPTVITVNKAGGSGAVALNYMKGKKGDNHTIMFTLNSFYTTPLRQPKLGINIESFTPIMRMAEDTSCLWVNTARKDGNNIKTVDDYVKAAKAAGDKWIMAGTGKNSDDNLLTDFLNTAYGLKMKYVPYKGGGKVAKQLAGNNADSTVSSPSEQEGFYKAGNIRPLACFTDKRIPLVPDAPTFKEIGKDFVYYMPRDVVGAPSMSADAKKYYNDLFTKVFNSKKWQGYRTKKALQGAPLTGANLLAYWKRERAVRKAMLKKMGVLNGGGDGPSTTEKQSFQGLFWNAWLENFRNTSTYKPVSTLKSGQEYRISFSLAGLPLGTKKVGIDASQARPEFKKRIDDLIKEGDPKLDLEVVLLYDPTYFEESEELNIDAQKRQKTIEIDINKIHNAKSDGFIKYQVLTPLEVLRNKRKKREEVDFSFGQVDFQLRTKDDLPSGRAALLFSIWDRGRPLDEVAVSFCTTVTNCASKQDVAASKGQLDVIGAIGNGNDPRRAGLHFVEMSTLNNIVMGVFRQPTNSGYKFHDWKVGPRKPLVDALVSIATEFTASENEDSRQIKGTELYNLLFPAVGNKRSNAARQALEHFARSQAKTVSGRLHKNAPPFFIRASMQDLNRPLIMPMGRVNIRRDDGSSLFLGHYFRIEMPLPIQAYQSGSRCLAKWVLAQPTTGKGVDSVLNVAFERYEKIGDVIRAETSKPNARAEKKSVYWINNVAVPVLDSVKKLRSWFGKPAMPEPILLSILSHHVSGKLSFTKGAGDTIGRLLMTRRFKAPSATILNGCDTGNQAATEIIRHLNIAGMQALIATNNGVPGDLAGDFLTCFVQETEKMKSARSALRDVFYSTLGCLDQIGKNKYGSRVLAYTLLGNGNLPLCRPGETK